MQDVNKLSVQLQLSELGLSLFVTPTLNPYQPLFEIDTDQNVLVQGHKIGFLDENGIVIFV